MHGKEHWKATDARLALAHTERLSKLSQAQMTQLREAEKLVNQAIALDEQQRYREAVTPALRGLALGKAILGMENAYYGKALNDLAFLYVELGEYGLAEPLYREALAVRLKVLGKHHPDYAETLVGLAILHQWQGHFSTAEPLFREALEIQGDLFGAQDVACASALNELGNLYRDQGDRLKAELCYRQVIAIRGKALEKSARDNSSSRATKIDNLRALADLHRDREDLAAAEPLYNDVLELLGEAAETDGLAYAFTSMNLGRLYLEWDIFGSAETCLIESAKIFWRVLGENHPDHALCLSDLAASSMYQGKFADAERRYKRALEIAKQLAQQHHPAYALGLHNLGVLHYMQGQNAEAEVRCREALEVTRQHLELTSAIQSERRQLAMTRKNRHYLDTYLAIGQDPLQSPTLAAQWVTRWKGAVWMRQRKLRALSSDPQLSAKFQQFQLTSAEIAQLAMNPPHHQDIHGWRRRLDQLAQQSEQLEQDLAAKSSGFRQGQKSVTLEELITALPPDAALVDFLEYSHLVPPVKGQLGRGTHESRLVAFVLRPGQAVQRIDLGLVKPIAEAITTWRRTYGQGAEGSKAGAFLRTTVWLPVEAKLAEAKLVLVSPDGVLGRLPLAALPGKAADSYLLEDWAIASVPVPQALPALLAEAKVKAGGLLLLGGIDYDAAPADLLAGPEPKTPPARPTAGYVALRGAEWRAFTRLEGTHVEITAIEDLHRKLFADRPLVKLEESQGSKGRLIAAAKRSSYIHLATHGFFAPPELVSALTPSGHADENLIGHHPGLLSGVALAGANRPATAGSDGILTADEVTTLNLENVELVTLSACETGLGESAGGEGVLGLQRALQIAGAHSTITSLWKVDDLATERLMTRFYQNLWEKNLGKLAALREAQLWLLNEGRQDPGLARGIERHRPANVEPDNSPRAPPFFWAAFTLSGDWR
jgi:CHAT domain-containing protein/Tfp pilus assembly protein PilF